MNSDISVFFIESEGFKDLSENHSEQWNNLLNQIAVLRWGYDENKIESRINTLKNDLLAFNSFCVFAVKNKMPLQSKSWENINLIGFAYFCQDENDENQWYYGDLVIHPKYRKLGIFKRLVITRHWKSGKLISCINSQIAERILKNNAMLELKHRKASKLFTYIEKDNKSSILLHEKLGFFPSENQEIINGFDKNNRIVYECIV